MRSLPTTSHNLMEIRSSRGREFIERNALAVATSTV